VTDLPLDRAWVETMDVVKAQPRAPAKIVDHVAERVEANAMDCGR
jgi:hypothetical protein